MKEKRVYLPRWQIYFLVPLMLIIWGFITYQAFFTERGKELGFIGWFLLSALFLLLIVMFSLMAFKKLPAYILVEK